MNAPTPAQRQIMPNGLPFVKLVVGIPNGGDILIDPAISLMANFDTLGYIPPIIHYESCYVHKGRDHCARQARLMGAEYLFFHDTDVVLPPNALATLIKHAVRDDLDVVGASYVLRRPPHTLVGERYDGEQVVPGEGMMRMRILPTGCMLINMRVFDDLPEPYFQTPVLLRKDKDGHEALQEVGEDVDFCERLIARGRQIWCDMTLTRKIGHVAKVVLTVDGIMRGMEVQQKLATAKAPADG